MKHRAHASSYGSNRVSASMSHKEPSSTEVAYRVLEELEAFQGVYWREVKGEFHTACDEIAIWVLLSMSAT